MSTTHSREGKDEANAIQHEICQVEELIQQLQERRLTLLRRLNDIQASTAYLPPEALSLIFECACSQYYDHIHPSTPAHIHPWSQEIYPALTFSHVSSHWREVAWSTPQLWNRMGAVVTGRNADRIPRILELHLQNAKALPFDLSLIFGSNSFNTIKSILFDSQDARKIRTLQLTAPPLQWLSHIPASFPQLEYIYIGNLSGDHRHALSLESASLLHHVHLQRLSMKVSLPWSSITHVNLDTVPIDTCAKLLIQCPNLIYFRSARPPHVVVEPTIFTHITTLQHLQTFLWEYIRSPWCLAALQFTRLPALRMLSWTDNNTWGEEVQPRVYALFAHLPDTLLNIELVSVTLWTLPLFKHAFGRSSYVQDLTMSSFARKSLYAALCALCPGWEDDRTEYLPYLKSLVITSRPGDRRTFDIDFSRRILDICKAKHARPDPRFTLELKGLKMEWAPGVQEELREMVRDSSQLNIQEWYTYLAI